MKARVLVGLLAGISILAVAAVSVFPAMGKYFNKPKEKLLTRSESEGEVEKGEKVDTEVLLNEKAIKDCEGDGECRSIRDWLKERENKCQVFIENSEHPDNSSRRLPYFRYIDHIYGMDDEVKNDRKPYADDCDKGRDLAFRFDVENSGWVYLGSREEK